MRTSVLFTNLFLGLIFIFISACGGGNDFMKVPLSSFDIKNELLEDKSLVQVLSFSGMPDNNENFDYYIHMIIVSVDSKDTFNLLTIDPSMIIDDSDKQMHFFAQKSVIYQTMFEELKKTKKSEHKGEITEVALDKKFESDIHNNYPTVIGILGTLTKN